MASKIYKDTRIQTKRDTASNWETNNPVLLNGEEIIVDTNSGEVRKKIGDGVKTYTQLPFTDEILRTQIGNKVEKVDGKGLSTNDYTTAEKNKLSGLKNYTHPTQTAQSSDFYKFSVSNEGHVNTVTKVTKADITALGIPGENTVYTHPEKHSPSIIEQDEDNRFVSDVQIASWDNKASNIAFTEHVEDTDNPHGVTKAQIGLGSVENKSSSTIRSEITKDNVVTALGYTPPEKDTNTWIAFKGATTSAAGTAGYAPAPTAGAANRYLRSDGTWVVPPNDNTVYTHPETHPATMITQDDTHRFVTDTEKSTWNAKADASDLTSHTGNKSNPHAVTKAQVGLGNVENKSSATIRGEITKSDVTTALGYTPIEKVEDYAHPETHPATMITEDTSHRFVTDSQISTWNAKASTAVATTTTNGLMSSADKTKLEGIEAGANNYSHPATHAASMITQDSTHRFVTDTEKTAWNSNTTAIATLNGTGEGSVKKQVDDAIASVVADAPEDFDTLKEISDFITNDTTGAAALSNAINNIVNGTTKVPKATNADTVNGKTVAVNVPADAKFTDTVYTHPATHAASMITEDSTHRFVTDTQISAWNAKASTAVATQSANGLMSSTDKKKLDGIAEGANNYTHPSSHAASMITEDTSHRFVTDTQISNWNAAKTHADSAHAPAGAEVNQNAFSNVKVGTTTIAADNKTDTLNLVAGSNVTITPDADSDTITIAAKDTTYSHPTYTVGSTTSTASPGHSGTFTAIDGITTNNLGHVTSINTKTITLPADNNTVYTHPTYTSKTSGLYKITVDGTGHVSATTAVAKADITALGIPGSDTTYSAATTSAAGLMSAADKVKLNGIADGANKTTVENVLTSTSTTNALSAAQGKALMDKITAIETKLQKAVFFE